MPYRMRALGVWVLAGLIFSAACSVKNPEDGAGGSGAPNAFGGAGASSAGRGGLAGAGTTHGGAGGAGSASGAGAGKGGSGVTDAGASGEAGAAPSTQCPKCASGFCFLDGTCVDCLPSQDNCPEGEVCGSTNTCVPGCKVDGTSCASGVCKDAHDCQSCLGDSECGGGHLCGDNQCAPACTAEQEGTSAGCGPGLTCCGLHCVDAQTDSQNCGACGAACTAGKFCGLTACADLGAAGAGQTPSACVSCQTTTLSNICAIPKVAVVLDGQDGNQVPGRAMAAALVAQCDPAPKPREVSQTVPDALNPASGRPISGAHELLVAAGGSYYARLLGYVDSEKISPVYWHYDNLETVEFRLSATDAPIISRSTTEPSEDHDFFVIQFMRDPTSGSLVLNAEGFWESGTVAATYFFANEIVPNRASYGKAWYAGEWQDKDGDHKPDLDEISVIASAP